MPQALLPKLSQSNSAKPNVGRGFTQVPNTLILDTRLSSNARLVWIFLKYLTRPGKMYAWPSQISIAQNLMWRTKNETWDRCRVQRALAELEELNLVSSHRSSGRKTNTYALQEPPPDLSDAILKIGIRELEENGFVKPKEKSKKAKRKSPAAPTTRAEHPENGADPLDECQQMHGDIASAHSASAAHASLEQNLNGFEGLASTTAQSTNAETVLQNAQSQTDPGAERSILQLGSRDYSSNNIDDYNIIDSGIHPSSAQLVDGTSGQKVKQGTRTNALTRAEILDVCHSVDPQLAVCLRQAMMYEKSDCLLLNFPIEFTSHMESLVNGELKEAYQRLDKLLFERTSKTIGIGTAHSRSQFSQEYQEI